MVQDNNNNKGRLPGCNTLRLLTSLWRSGTSTLREMGAGGLVFGEEREGLREREWGRGGEREGKREQGCQLVFCMYAMYVCMLSMLSMYVCIAMGST